MCSGGRKKLRFADNTRSIERLTGLLLPSIRLKPCSQHTSWAELNWTEQVTITPLHQALSRAQGSWHYIDLLCSASDSSSRFLALYTGWNEWMNEWIYLMEKNHRTRRAIRPLTLALIQQNIYKGKYRPSTVSYTHLTLPTKRIV